MRHALIITAYKDFDRIAKLASKLDDRFSLYIHIDLKSAISDQELAELSALKNTHVYRKLVVNWGGINHFHALMFLAKEALKDGDIGFFHTISGQDIMTVSCDKFCSFFDEHRQNNFIEYYAFPNPYWHLGGYDRVDYYNFFDTFNTKKMRGYKIVTIARRIQRALHLKRQPIPLPLYGLGTWWSINREAMAYVIDYLHNNPKLYKRFDYTFCAEEILPQTILANSPLSSTVINDDLRFIDWSERVKGVAPSLLNESDFENIIKSKDVFARKIGSPDSDKLEVMIAERVAAGL